MKPIIVTRHPALVAYLKEKGIVAGDVEVLAHVTSADQIKNRHVIGVLPLSLAAEANFVTEIPLTVTPEMRGRELSLEDLRSIAGPARTYRVVEFTEGD